MKDKKPAVEVKPEATEPEVGTAVDETSADVEEEVEVEDALVTFEKDDAVAIAKGDLLVYKMEEVEVVRPKTGSVKTPVLWDEPKGINVVRADAPITACAIKTVTAFAPIWSPKYGNYYDAKDRTKTVTRSKSKSKFTVLISRQGAMYYFRHGAAAKKGLAAVGGALPEFKPYNISIAGIGDAMGLKLEEVTDKKVVEETLAAVDKWCETFKIVSLTEEGLAELEDVIWLPLEKGPEESPKP
ncbi:MAG: hypothetical protein M0R66_07620 [Candidatus Omnitrophica bacterium]|nr:hypothetical protein [Candidatus Omnitrophota bacterium]